jgi:hypothetical protein
MAKVSGERRAIDAWDALDAAQAFLEKSEAAAIAAAGGSVLDVARAPWDQVGELS